MKPTGNLDFESLRALYEEYKDFLIPVGMILLSILLLFFFSIPQIRDIFAARDEAKRTAQKVRILKANIALLSQTQEAVLNDDITTVISALPPQKDYIGILNAISSASQKSNIAISDYSFQVGAVSGSTKSDKTRVQPSTSSPGIAFSLSINGTAVDAQRFIKALSETLPLSEISSITGNKEGGSSVNVSFYYVPFVKNQNTASVQPLQYVTDQNRQILDQLKQWQGANGTENSNDVLNSF